MKYVTLRDLSNGSITAFLPNLVPQYPGLNLMEVSPGMLSFQCMAGLVPKEEVTSVCGEDGHWRPDPVHHTCTNESAAATTIITTG